MPLSPSHELMSYEKSFLVLFIPDPLELRERQGPPKEADTLFLRLGLKALLLGMSGMVRKGHKRNNTARQRICFVVILLFF